MIKSLVRIALFTSTLLEAQAFPTKEVGIVLLLPAPLQASVQDLSVRLSKKFKENFLPFEEVPSIPHLTIYQLNVEVRLLGPLKKKLKDISDYFNPFECTLDSFLTDTQENIFWNLQITKIPRELLELNKRVVEEISSYRASTLMQQVQDISLNESQKKLVKKYGIFWSVPENFKPHLTLLYNSGLDRVNSQGRIVQIQDLIKNIKPGPQKFVAQELALVEIGYAGNALKILEKYPLCS